VSTPSQLDQARKLRASFASAHDPRARRRILVILCSLRGNRTVLQIAHRLGLARSTVFAYRRLYAVSGIEGLLAHTRRGRPATPVSPALDQIIVKGLRLLSWFNIPALRKWIGHYDRIYPVWTVRRWALSRIKRWHIRFPKDWRAELANSYREWQHSLDPTDNPYTRWRHQRALRESTEPTLALVVAESAGLLPWRDFADNAYSSSKRMHHQ
jgi:hypothetical protein